MMFRSTIFISLILAGLAGCGHEPSVEPGPEKVVVTVSTPVRRQVTEYAYFTGRIAAKESVTVRARVNGYLAKVFFKEGEEVEKGEKLFEIDQRPYKADYDRAVGDVERAKATAKAAVFESERQRELFRRAATSKSDYDKAIGKEGEAVASVHAAEAAVEQARLNLQYCTITSEIQGRAGRYEITPGNLVTAKVTQLTTVVSVEPMYAYFDVDELTMIRFKELIRSGKIKSAADEIMPIDMALANDTGFPHAGAINFVDNQVDPNTGTLKVRGVFPNPIKNNLRLLAPGMFCRIRLAVGPAYSALVVSERAIGSDQGQKYVLIVDDQNVVQFRPVKTGPAVTGLRAIESGINDHDRVIIMGQQRVRPGMTVEPKSADMVIEPKRAG